MPTISQAKLYLTKVLPKDSLRVIWGLGIKGGDSIDPGRAVIHSGFPTSLGRLKNTEIKGTPAILEVLKSTLAEKDMETIQFNPNEAYSNALLKIDSIRIREKMTVNAAMGKIAPDILIDGEFTFGDEVIKFQDIYVNVNELLAGMRIEIPDKNLRENFLCRVENREKALSLLVNAVESKPEVKIEETIEVIKFARASKPSWGDYLFSWLRLLGVV